MDQLNGQSVQKGIPYFLLTSS